MNFLILIITAVSLMLLFLAERRRHTGLRKMLSAGYTGFAPGGKSCIRGVCLALGAILLAGGTLLLPDTEKAGEPETPVLFCILDCSLSMQAESGTERSRLQDAKKYLQTVAAGLPGWELGLLTFEGSAFLDFPPSIDHDGWQQALAAVQAGSSSNPGSAPGEALKLAQDSAAGLGITDAVLLLLSDGEINAPDPVGEGAPWTQRRFPCIQVLCGKEGEAKPVPGPGGWLRTSAGGVAMSAPDSSALRERLGQSPSPTLSLTAEAGADSVLAAVRRFWGQGEAGGMQFQSGQLSANRTAWASLLLLLSFLLLLVGLSPSRWLWQRQAVLLLLSATVGSGWAAEAESAFSLTRRGYALCLEAQKEPAPEKWLAGADCFRRALRLQPGFLPAAVNLEFALLEWGRQAAAPERQEPAAPEPDNVTDSPPPPPDSEAGKIPAAVPQQSAADAAASESEDELPGASRPGHSTWRALRQRRSSRRITVPACPPW